MNKIKEQLNAIRKIWKTETSKNNRRNKRGAMKRERNDITAEN